MRTAARWTGALVVMLGAHAAADTIVQDGSLSGGLGHSEQEIVLDQFDTQRGTRQLNFVQLDFLTAVIGGGTTTGEGGTVTIFAQLSADYSLDGELLAETEAIVDTVLSNAGNPNSYSVFDNDVAQVIIDQAPDLAPWTGAGQLTLDAVVDFAFSEDPPGTTGFSAGGSVQYTVTYDFDVLPVGDLDGDGFVTVTDLLILLADWGPCPGCPADLDDDDQVGVTDLLQQLANWS